MADSIPLSAFPLPNSIQKTLEDNGISSLFPFQSKIVDHIDLFCRNDRPGDIIVSAPTGSGKTLVYVIPTLLLLLRLLEQDKFLPQGLYVLIVVPTRVLVKQVCQVFGWFSNLGFSAYGCHGQTPFQRELSLIAGPIGIKFPILVVTPGRLVDHLSFNPNFILNNLELLILDEMDMLLSHSYSNWLQSLLQILSNSKSKSNAHLWNKNPQFYSFSHNPAKLGNLHSPIPQSVYTRKLLFSATVTRNPRQILDLQLFQPVLYDFNPVTETLVSMNRYQMEHIGDNSPLNSGSEGIKLALPSSLIEIIVKVRTEIRPFGLLYLLKSKDIKRALIFVNSTQDGKKLKKFLSLNLPKSSIGVYHGGLGPSKRNFILKQFARDEINFLVSTDVLSRGIDLVISHIINYNAIFDQRTYVHRAGRTARAGRNGTCWSIIPPSGYKQFLTLQSSISKKSTNSQDSEQHDSNHRFQVISISDDDIQMFLNPSDSASVSVSGGNTHSKSKKVVVSQEIVSEPESEDSLSDWSSDEEEEEEYILASKETGVTLSIAQQRVEQDLQSDSESSESESEFQAPSIRGKRSRARK